MEWLPSVGCLVTLPVKRSTSNFCEGKVLALNFYLEYVLTRDSDFTKPYFLLTRDEQVGKQSHSNPFLLVLFCSWFLFDLNISSDVTWML